MICPKQWKTKKTYINFWVAQDILDKTICAVWEVCFDTKATEGTY